MEEFYALIFGIGIFIILLLILFFTFIIWLIKKGVKNAIDEALDDERNWEDLKLVIAEAIIIAQQKDEPKENIEEDIEKD